MLHRVLALLAVVLACSWSLASAQSLGELAKKTAADREKAKATENAPADKPVAAAAKKYTNDDLAHLQPIVGGTAEGTPATETTAKEAPPATADKAIAEHVDTKKDRDYWFGRMNALLSRQDEDTIAAAAAEKREAQYQAELSESERSIGGEVYVDRILKQKYLDARDETSRLRAAVNADKAAIAALEEEARQAAVPPGWLRR